MRVTRTESRVAMRAHAQSHACKALAHITLSVAITAH